MHHMCYEWCGCGVGCCVVALLWCGMCAMLHDMNDDDAGVVYCLVDKMCCDGDGGGTYLAVGKCSVEAHNSHHCTCGVSYMS